MPRQLGLEPPNLQALAPGGAEPQLRSTGVRPQGGLGEKALRTHPRGSASEGGARGKGLTGTLPQECVLRLSLSLGGGPLVQSRGSNLAEVSCFWWAFVALLNLFKKSLFAGF